MSIFLKDSAWHYVTGEMKISVGRLEDKIRQIFKSRAKDEENKSRKWAVYSRKPNGWVISILERENTQEKRSKYFMKISWNSSTWISRLKESSECPAQKMETGPLQIILWNSRTLEIKRSSHKGAKMSVTYKGWLWAPQQ